MIAIAAIGKRNQMGLNGDLPWDPADYAEDLAWLRGITVGRFAVAGHNTFSQLPPSLKRAAGRCEKISGSENYGMDTLLLGGAATFRERWDEIVEMWITHVDYDGDADVYFPEIKENEWEEVDRFRISPKAVVAHYYKR